MYGAGRRGVRSGGGTDREWGSRVERGQGRRWRHQQRDAGG